MPSAPDYWSNIANDPTGSGNAWDRLQREESWQKAGQVDRAARGLTSFEQGGNLDQDQLDAISKERGIYNRLLENSGRQSTLRGLALQRQIQQNQGDILGRFPQLTNEQFDIARQQMEDLGQQRSLNQDTYNLLQGLKSQPGSGERAGQELERRRFLMDEGKQTQDRAVRAQMARSGLGGSGAGLFAAQNAANQRQRSLQGLELSRPDLENTFENQMMQRRQALLGQYEQGNQAYGQNSILRQQGIAGLIGNQNQAGAGVSQPEVQFTPWQKPKSFFQKAAGALGGLGAKAIGAAAGAFTGGIGAGLGSQLGGQIFSSFGSDAGGAGMQRRNPYSDPAAGTMFGGP